MGEADDMQSSLHFADFHLSSCCVFLSVIDLVVSGTGGCWLCVGSVSIPE